jgi:hypothetical protein
MAPKLFALALALHVGVAGGATVAWQQALPHPAPLPTFEMVITALRPVCLPYDQPVTLTGTIERVKAVSMSDTPQDETHFELVLPTPICVAGGDVFNPDEADVTRLQIWDGALSPRQAGRHVRLTGMMWHAQTTHHHTTVLINIQQLEETK